MPQWDIASKIHKIRQRGKARSVNEFLEDRELTWKAFIEQSRSFFDVNWGCPMFQLIEILDEVYRTAYARAPFPKGNSEPDNLLRMGFLICHRALLASATSAGSGLPEDGAAASRRALEAARVCLAIKADPDNFSKWRATDERRERWEGRLRGENPPKPLNPRYLGLSTEPLYEELQTAIGVLSDFTVHFTPEHVLRYEWDQVQKTDGTSATAFGLGEDAVTRDLFMLVDLHRLIIRVFDRCLDGKLLESLEVKQIAERALTLYKELLQRGGLLERVAAAGDSW